MESANELLDAAVEILDAIVLPSAIEEAEMIQAVKLISEAQRKMKAV